MITFFFFWQFMTFFFFIKQFQAWWPWSLIKYVEILTLGVFFCPLSLRPPFSGFLLLEVSSLAVRNILRRGRWRRVCCRGLQQTPLQQPLLRMSPIARNETLRGRNPRNGGHRDFRRRGCRQSGFQYTYRPRPSSLELFSENHNAGCEIFSHSQFMTCCEQCSWNFKQECASWVAHQVN